MNPKKKKPKTNLVLVELTDTKISQLEHLVSGWKDCKVKGRAGKLWLQVLPIREADAPSQIRDEAARPAKKINLK